MSRPWLPVDDVHGCGLAFDTLPVPALVDFEDVQLSLALLNRVRVNRRADPLELVEEEPRVAGIAPRREGERTQIELRLDGELALGRVS